MATKKTSKPKTPVDYTSKLYIGNEMAALDRKDRDYYDNLSDDEKKQISPFTFIRWSSAVTDKLGPYDERNGYDQANYDLQAYYLLSANERVNKHFFDISATQHKKLLWLLSTTVSPGMGKYKHNWIKAPGRHGSGNNRAEKFFAEIYPNAKPDEIKMLAEINDRDDIKELARAHGWDDRRIKDYI
jgi:hypothetical protein